MRIIKNLFKTGVRSAKKTLVRNLSMLTVMIILSLTVIQTNTLAVNIEQTSVPTLMSVEGPENESPDEEITVSLHALEQSDSSKFDDAIVDDIKIIFNSFEVSVEVYGKTYRVETTGGTVHDAIKEVFELNEGDTVNYPLTDTLTPGMQIKVTDIEYVTQTKQAEQNFENEIIYSSDYYTGQIVEVAGQTGIVQYTYKYKYVDGQLTDTELLKEEKIRDVINSKTIVGTKNATKTYVTSGVNYVSALSPEADFALDDNYRPINYSRLITGTASAYSSDQYTATGKTCRTGYVAVNPSIIPYHTKMYIVCSDNSYFYGYASAEDTGGFIHWGTRVVDLYFNTEAECETFGLRNVEMYLF
ncbi:MAG: 3D domain-containing protein [Acutalibacteraceae bacterium]|nr:3D domain-containing protein [Acutalibacteraceae bacterium]